ncbi:restriction endonuclease subunit S [Cetobacterium sp.]
MSKLEQLINKLCPNGVEYKTLSDVLKIKNGKDYKQFKEGNIPVYGSGGIIAYIDVFVLNKPSVLIPRKGSIDKLYYVEKPFWTVDTIFYTEIYTDIVIPKFVFYYLQKEHLEKYNIAGGVPSLTQAVLNKISFPIPPLPVQEEIVRILDTFAELTTELTTELTMRKQQYEYFETTLLFDSKYPRVLLKDVCTVNQGLQIPINQRKTENGENRYFYITVQFLKGDNEDKYYIENPNESVICILVTRTGSTGKIITGVHGCFHNNFFKVNCFNTINKRYMYYFLNSQVMFRKLLHTASGGTVPDLPHNKFYKLEIPLPSLEEQQRIVDILDRFDTLVNDIKIGLPAEIEARQRQYEYYRDKLLTFKK